MNMSDAKATADVSSGYYRLEQNQELVLKLFGSYYRAQQHTGKMYEELPNFFMVKPAVLAGKELAIRPSDKLILDDCIQRAAARNGFVGVIKHHNPKLNYFWLELVVMPFMLGDVVTEDNQSSFFYLLSRFIEHAKNNSKLYGDMTAELDSDKDLALMLKEINKLGEKMRPLMEIYPEEQLVSFNRNWPLAEVQKLLASLKDNDLSWCEVFFEYLIYAMGRKGKS